MVLMLGVWDTILNFLRGWSPTLQVAFVFIFLLAILLSYRRALLKKNDGKYGWLIVTVLLLCLFVFYVYAVF